VQSDDLDLLKGSVSRYFKKGYAIISLGLRRGTEYVKKYYPNSVANMNVQELSKVFGR
jgi:hypothetical protein